MDVDKFTSRWLFVAAFVSTIIVYTVSATLFGSAQAVWGNVSNPSIVLSMLAASLPEQSGVLIAWVIVTGVQGWAMELLRPFDLLCWSVCRRRDASTRKLVRRLREKADRAPYVSFLPVSTLVVSVALIFGWMNVAMWPCVAGYFLIARAVAAHQLLYVYEKPMEAGGQFWHQAIDFIFGGLGVSLAVWIAYFYLREADALASVSIALLVCAMLVRVVWYYRFDRPLQALPPELAAAVQQAAATGLAVAALGPAQLPAVAEAAAAEPGDPHVSGVPLADAESKAAAPTPVQSRRVADAGTGPGRENTWNAGAESRATAAGSTAAVATAAESAMPISLPMDELAALMRRNGYPKALISAAVEVVTSLRDGQADIQQWYVPQRDRPSPYVAPAWRDECDMVPGAFQWAGDGQAPAASRMKAWIPSGAAGSGVLGAGELPLAAVAALHPVTGHRCALAGSGSPASTLRPQMAEVETQRWVTSAVRRRR